MTEKPWWETAFEADYLQVYAHRSDEAAAAEVAGIESRLLKFPGLILDAACGSGRHLQALRAAGYAAWGFDYSSALLQEAEKTRASIAQALFRADVRSIPCAPCFSTITLFFTAFGYFSDEMNQQALQALVGCLAERGQIMLDLPDPSHLRASLVPSSEKIDRLGRQVVEERSLEGSYVCKKVDIRENGHSVRSYTERVRLYTETEMAELADSVGLRVDTCWQSLQGPHHNAHRRVYWLQR